MKTFELSGSWLYSLEDKPVFAEPFIDDSHWPRINIPQNWFLAGLEHHGVVWFRHTFHYSPGDISDHQTLRFDGVDYFADVYLNGHHLGHHEGYFEPFWFDVTDTLRDGMNVLAVRVDSPFEKTGTDGWHMRKKLIKGVLNHHDCRPGRGWDHTGQSHNTGGIWNRVSLLAHGDVTVEYQFLSANFDPGVPELKLDLVINNRSEEIVSVTNVRIVPENFSAEQEYKGTQELSLTPGISTHTLNIPVPEVRRWNPWERGFPHLYRVELALNVNDLETVSRESIFGFRTVSVDEGFNWTINGEPFYPRGTNYIASQWLSETLFTEAASSAAQRFGKPETANNHEANVFKRDVSLMVEANLNMVRVHAHVLPREFHTACDRAGIMVWQDFPLQWGYSDEPAFHHEAERQVKAMLRLLYNHPSIVAWCAHNETPWEAEWMANDADGSYDPDQNRALDQRLVDTLQTMDPTRYAHMNSGTGDGHMYPGWYNGKWEDFENLTAAPFPTEYGAQAVPIKEHLLKIFDRYGPDGGYSEMVKFVGWIVENMDLVTGRNLPPLDKVPIELHAGYKITELWRFHNFQPYQTFVIAKIPLMPVLDRFIEESHRYQCWITQFGTETIRANRDKTTGVFHFMMIDPWPSITWSVLDYWRTPKPSYEVLSRVMQPVLPVVKGILQEHKIDEEQDWHLTITNDHLEPITEATCKWMFSSGMGQEESGSFKVEIPGFGVSEPVSMPEVTLQEGENYLAVFIYDQDESLIAKNHYFFTGISS